MGAVPYRPGPPGAPLNAQRSAATCVSAGTGHPASVMTGSPARERHSGGSSPPGDVEGVLQTDRPARVGRLRLPAAVAGTRSHRHDVVGELAQRPHDLELPDVPGDVEHPVLGERDRPLDAEHRQPLSTGHEVVVDGPQILFGQRRMPQQAQPVHVDQVDEVQGLSLHAEERLRLAGTAATPDPQQRRFLRRAHRRIEQPRPGLAVDEACWLERAVCVAARGGDDVGHGELVGPVGHATGTATV